jgi:hypothetical protein
MTAWPSTCGCWLQPSRRASRAPTTPAVVLKNRGMIIGRGCVSCGRRTGLGLACCFVRTYVCGGAGGWFGGSVRWWERTTRGGGVAAGRLCGVRACVCVAANFLSPFNHVRSLCGQSKGHKKGGWHVWISRRRVVALFNIFRAAPTWGRSGVEDRSGLGRLSSRTAGGEGRWLDSNTPSKKRPVPVRSLETRRKPTPLGSIEFHIDLELQQQATPSPKQSATQGFRGSTSSCVTCWSASCPPAALLRRGSERSRSALRTSNSRQC